MNEYIYKLDDNAESLGLLTILKDFAENIDSPFEDHFKRIYELEFKRRDGFIPYSHNKGGIDFIAITDYRTIIGTGICYNKDVFNHCLKIEKESHDEILKDNPDIKEQSEEYYELMDEYLSGEYNEIAFRVRIMYNGNNELTIFTGYDFDAPYFRGNFKYGNEFNIKFKNKKDLGRKLIKLIDKI